MDLGIAGRWAIVCASSSGLGRACAEALVAEGVNVVINGRDGVSLQRVADEIAVLGAGTVVPAAADITTDAGRAALLAACPAPDMLVLNNRGPKPGDLAEAIGAGIEEGLDLHYRAPLALVDGVLGGMRDRRFGRIVTITSAMVASPRSGMTSSAGARAGQWAVLKALACDVVADGVTINNLLPERFATQRQIDNALRSVARRGCQLRRCLGCAGRQPADQTAWGARRVRRHLRVRVQRARRVHDRHVDPPRRRQLSRPAVAADCR